MPYDIQIPKYIFPFVALYDILVFNTAQVNRSKMKWKRKDHSN